MTTARDITIYQGQAFALSLDYAGTAGRGQRMHIRLADSTATVIQILTHNGDANARVLFDGTSALDITIGASVSAGWVVLADRVEWVYDIEDYDLADEDDCVIPYRGKIIVRGNRTRASDVTPSEQMPSGDGRYVRYDTDAQGLSDAQKLAARTNIGAGTGSGGGSVDDGDKGDVTVSGTGTVWTVDAGAITFAKMQAVSANVLLGNDAAGTAVEEIACTAAGRALLDDADASAQRATLGLGTAATTAATAYEASGAVSTHNSVTTAHGISAFGATLVDDADAATARTTLGLGTAATSASGDFATAGHNHSGVYQPADAELTAIAGLTSAADSAPYFTGSGTAALMTITAAGRAIIDDADATAQRATLGIVIGTDVQAYDADLTTWATITPGTGVGTALAVDVGTAGSVVTNGGALGTPSSGNLANCTGYPGGSGDVAGPASSTDNAVARFDSTTGKLLQNTTNVTIADTGALAITPDANAKAITVASHTHTTSNPAIDVAQTWNAAGVAFTAEKTNVTNTASAAGSLLRDWQVGGTTVANITKTGKFVSNPTVNTDFFSGQYAGTEYVRLGYGGVGGYGMFQTGANNGFAVSATPTIYASGAWTSGTTSATFLTFSNASSTAPYVTFEAVGLTTKPGIRIKQSTSTTALPFEIQLNSVRQMAITPAGIVQTFGAYTDDSNYVRGALSASSTAVTLAAETAGTGADDVPVSVVPAGAAGVILGASGAGSAKSVNHYNKSVTGIADATATDILTVTVPNAAHSASIEVILNGSLGAGGAIGANEATGTVVYNVSIARTAGVNAVATISTAYGSSTSAVAGAATITVTGDLGAVSGAVGAANTFTIRATITKGSGASANHTCVATARVLNANASGITIA